MLCSLFTSTCGDGGMRKALLRWDVVCEGCESSFDP